MSVATLTSKGQITIPKEIRDELGLRTGSKVMFVTLRNGEVRMVRRTGSIEDLAGLLYDPDRPAMTIEEINDAIAEGGAESGMRGLR